jgi:hypothetical protein
MTRYTVVWVESALDELAEIWMDASDRNAVTVAAQTIDAELGHDASAKGSEISEGLRSLTAPPLKAIFCVREPDRIAEVLRVKTV